MEINNTYNNYAANYTNEVNGKKQVTEDKDTNTQKENNATGKTADALINDGISIELSKRGLALAGEMEPFIDTYETTCTLLKGTGHIGSEQMMNGGFADALAENYQNELQRIKENYSGKEYDRQLEILDKAYDEAAQSVSRGYVKQLKMLTGDIVIKPQTGISYSSEAEAEKAYQANLEKDGKRESVIDSELSDTIRGDVKNILLQLKNVSLNKQEQKNSVWGNFMSYTDIKKLGSYLKNATYGTDDVSDFSKSLLERYATSGDVL
jgi:hypothetical protein